MVKVRTDIAANYRGIFFNGKTIRQRINSSMPITTPSTPEIEDVAINSKCYANCFIAGTQVRTNNGYKNIEDICIDDTVVSLNERTGDFEYKKVYQLFKNVYKGDIISIELESEKHIFCTPNHKFFTNNGWVEARNLTLNDNIEQFEMPDIAT